MRFKFESDACADVFKFGEADAVTMEAAIGKVG